MKAQNAEGRAESRCPAKFGVRHLLRVKQAARSRALPPNEANHKSGATINFTRRAIYIAGAVLLFAAAEPARAGLADNDYAIARRSSGIHKARVSYALRLAPHFAAAAAEQEPKGEIIPASLGSLARGILPAGIYPASGKVATSCFNARMVKLLAAIQRKYRRPLIITSGYRGHLHNISAGGVRGSLHTACAAADIKIPGISKYQLASYVRSLPNRGGVGLYCHDAVHVDIGSPREWNWCAAAGKHSRHRRHH